MWPRNTFYSEHFVLKIHMKLSLLCSALTMVSYRICIINSASRDAVLSCVCFCSCHQHPMFVYATPSAPVLIVRKHICLEVTLMVVVVVVFVAGLQSIESIRRTTSGNSLACQHISVGAHTSAGANCQFGRHGHFQLLNSWHRFGDRRMVPRWRTTAR